MRINTAQDEHCSEPITFEEVMTSPEERWIEAMNKEMASIKANDVYDLVKLPKKKINADGSERYKARLVVQGFSQRAGQDYDETLCPVSSSI